MPTIPLLDEKAIWLVPLAFYIYDNFCVLNDYQVILLEDYRLNWTFKLAKIPFIFAGKHLYILPLFLPFVFAFKLPWMVAGKTVGIQLSQYRRRVLIWRSKLYEFRIIAVCAWINLFLVGPLLTAIGGFLFALRVALPIHAGLLVATIVLIALYARLLGFSRGAILSCAAELILSPGYLPNICRRLSLAQAHGDIDGVFFLKRYGQPSTVDAIVEVVQFRLSEMTSERGENGWATEDLEAYAAALRP
jgi:hypothetical protein